MNQTFPAMAQPQVRGRVDPAVMASLAEMLGMPSSVADSALSAAQSEPAPSWMPVSMTQVVNGDRKPILPTVGRRDDGVPLLYPGREHYVAAEPESGKTWLMCLIVRDHLADGGRVLYVDFEDDERAIGGRLLDLGVTGAVLTDPLRFAYVRPNEPTLLEYQRLLEGFQPTLVLLDGVTEGYGLHGWAIEKNEDSPKWRRTFVKPALQIGAATLASDHVVKSRENRGGYAIGAQHKKAGLTGVAFELRNVKPFGRGLKGTSRLVITKDRPGGLRGHGVRDGKSRDTVIGDLVLDDEPREDVAADVLVRLHLYAPIATEDENGGQVQLTRATQALRAAIVQAIQDQPGCSKAHVEAVVRETLINDRQPGRDAVREQLARLIDIGLVSCDGGANGRKTVLTLPSAGQVQAEQWSQREPRGAS